MTKGVLLPDGTVKPALVPYLRVSTDDKGQDAKRQILSIGPWADREGFILMAPEEDETSGSKVEALERRRFIAACERAQAAGAIGLIMESPDRFSRMDPIIAVWEMREVKRRFGLDIYFSGMPLEYQSNPMGKLVIFLQMASAHQWVIDHTKKVNTGMAKKKADGVKFGRKPKHLSAPEISRVEEWRREGMGWEKIANDLNALRGVHLIIEPRKKYDTMVSSGSLRRMMAEGIFRNEKTKRPISKTPDESLSSDGQNPNRQDDLVTSD